MKLKRILASALSLCLVLNIFSVVSADDKLWGDIDGDGELTATDSAMVMSETLKNGLLSEEQLALAEVDGDGVIGSNDSAFILSKVLNNAFVFPVEGATESTEATTAVEESTEATTAVEESTEVTTVVEESTEVTTEVEESTEVTTNVEESTEVTTTIEETTEVITYISEIYLADGASYVVGGGASVEGDIITITDAGEYTVSGSLSNGQLVVNSANDIDLILNGASITCLYSSPIYGISGDMSIKLQKGTDNVLTDSTTYTNQDENLEPDACLFSKDRITFKGAGNITINANYGDAIGGKDQVNIKNGNITINASDDGIRGKDYVAIMGGTLDITCVNTAIKSTKGYVIVNETEKAVSITTNAQKSGIQGETYVTIDAGTMDITAKDKGIYAKTGDITINGGVIGATLLGTDTTTCDYDGIKASATAVNINGGDITINCSMDGIQATTAINIVDGNINVTSGDNGITCDDTITISGGTIIGNTVGKGIKGGLVLNVNDGSINMTSTDDALHSNGSIAIKAGDMIISTGDDGVHADETLTVEGGNINITKSYEGLEAQDIVVNAGEIHVVASDDGINAAGGADGSGNGSNDQNPWGPGWGGNQTTSTGTININGGYIYVSAVGDGVDSNGALNFNGGTVIVQGPTDSGNGALDADGTISYSGGTVLAVGSSGMAETPASSSMGYTLSYKGNTISAGTLVAIVDGNENVLAVFKPEKNIQSIVFCSPLLTSGTKVTIYTGGSYTGVLNDDNYATGGTYTAGTAVGSATIANKVTSIGGNSPRNI